MSLYQRGKSWYYDFVYRGERYTGCIGPVSKTVAKEIMAKKKAEAVEGRYELPSKKPSPRLENFIVTDTLKAVHMHRLEASAVFCNLHGTPYHSFRTAFERAVRKAGMEDFTFHDLRHTFARRLVMSGVDLPTVQALIGHKDISMTLRYTHLSSDHKQRAVHALEKFGEKSQQFSQQERGQGTYGSRKSLKKAMLP